MLRRFLLLSVLVLAACTKSAEIYDLKCEGLREPLAIDSCEPHFSWKLRGKEGLAQLGFEIQVASSLKALTSGEADLWQSGRFNSDEQIMIPYMGSPLAPRGIYYWRVRIWKEDGEASSWSQAQRFGVGIVAPEKMRGEYIGAVPGEGRAPVFRKTFEYGGSTGPVLLNVNSLGYHEAYVNGKPVSDAVLTPAVSQLDKRSLIVSYDISGLLKKGLNEVRILAGSGWYKSTTFGAEYDGPLVRAEVYDTSTGDFPAVTDASWEAAWSGYKDSGTWTPHRFGGEIIDARVAGAEPAQGWIPAEVVALSAYPDASPQMCEPCRVQETLTPVSIVPCGDNSWLADFGKVVNAMVDFSLPAIPSGDTVKAYFSDFMRADGSMEPGGLDQYVSSGTRGRYCSKFNHQVFRFVRLEGLPSAPAAKDLKALRMRTDYAQESSFTSSDEDLNRIYALVSWTMENLAFDGYMVDCASIERLGYGGDGNASTLSLQGFADADALFYNWLQAWVDAQRPDGGLPHTAPNPYTAGGGAYWCSFLVQAPWRTFMSYRDPRLLEKCYPAMKAWIGYVDAYSREGLLERWPDLSYRGWFLGDWAAPQGTDVRDPRSVGFIANCALAQSYLCLVRIARVLGLDQDESEYRDRYTELIKKVHDKYYNPTDCSYASGSQIDMAYPLLVGIVPWNLKETVWNRLVEKTEKDWNGHLATGLVGVPVITELATLAGEGEWLYNLLKKRDYPGYLYMLDNGATGVWEEWDGGRSHLHNCYNGILSWFYQGLGGIQLLEPGYKTIRIEPQIPQGLDYVKVVQGTPYGTITVEYNHGSLTYSVPPGITVLPARQ